VLSQHRQSRARVACRYLANSLIRFAITSSARRNGNPEAALDRKDSWETFRSCLDKLSARVADVFVLREMEQMDTAQTCEALRISQNNLWVTPHRAVWLCASASSCIGLKGSRSTSQFATGAHFWPATSRSFAKSAARPERTARGSRKLFFRPTRAGVSRMQLDAQRDRMKKETGNKRCHKVISLMLTGWIYV
jgi:Sigma-70, region 4